MTIVIYNSCSVYTTSIGYNPNRIQLSLCYCQYQTQHARTNKTAPTYFRFLLLI